MKKRALVIGSQTGILGGVDADARLVQELLAERGFGAADIDLRTGDRATREGILDGYAALIGRSGPGDVALVYYSGHGSFEEISAGLSPDGPFSRRRYQGIVPFDYEKSTDTDFRGILAEELSILLFKLTSRTANAVVVLDCCHAALMSRDARAIPKAVPHPMRVGVEQCIADILAKEDPALVREALRSQGSDAVRLVACRQEQSAYELTRPDGTAYGVFTEGLRVALQAAKGQPVTWRDVAERASEYVLYRVPGQLPGAEGRTDRLLFDLAERGPLDASPIAETMRGWVLRRGRVFGVKVGDVYSIRPPPGAPDAELGEATVTQVDATESLVEVAPRNGASIPEGARGMPVAWADAPRLVRVPLDSERRDEIVAAVQKTPRLDVAPDGDESAPFVATVAVRDGVLSVLNRDGLPIRHDVPMTPATLAVLPAALRLMAQAAALRELHGDGILHVSQEDLEITFGLVVDGQPSPLPLLGATLGPGDGIFLRLANRSTRALHVHVFDIGVSDKVTLVTGKVWPTGVRIGPGAEELLFRHRGTNELQPLPFSWPETVPEEHGLRVEELLIVATAEPVDLTALEQPGVRGLRRRGERPPRLRHLVEQAWTGVTRECPVFGDPTDDGVLTKRVTFSLSPWPVKRGGARFLVDEQRPILDLAARPRGRRGKAGAPEKIAVVIHELVVHSNRALFSADIRVDALFVTPKASDGEPYRAGTMRFPNVKDGDRLPLDQLLVYMGPVKDFLQVCLWVSRDVKGSLELSDMLRAAGTSPEVKGALGALAVLAVSAPQAALVVGAVGAAVTLADVGYRLLTKAVGESIGVYRTSLLEADGFRIGRHPAQGLVRAQDFSFSFEVRDVR